MGIAEEGVKAVGGVLEGLRSNPLALANILLNICFLVFLIYYVSIIASRAQNTVREMFQAQDNLYKQWGIVIKDTQSLTEKAMHCILPEDALKLLQVPSRSPIEAPQRPSETPARPQSAPPLQHLLPPERRTEMEGKEVPHVVGWPPLPPSDSSTAPSQPAPPDDGK